MNRLHWKSPPPSLLASAQSGARWCVCNTTKKLYSQALTIKIQKQYKYLQHCEVRVSPNWGLSLWPCDCQHLCCYAKRSEPLDEVATLPTSFSEYFTPVDSSHLLHAFGVQPTSDNLVDKSGGGPDRGLNPQHCDSQHTTLAVTPRGPTSIKL